MTIPQSFVTQDGKYPPVVKTVKRQLVNDAFWDREIDRWALDDERNLREPIVAINYFLNQHVDDFIHISITRIGIMELTLGAADRKLHEQLSSSLPHLTISNIRGIGQGMYGFYIHLVEVPAGEEKQQLQDIELIVKQAFTIG